MIQIISQLSIVPDLQNIVFAKKGAHILFIDEECNQNNFFHVYKKVHQY